MKYGGFKIIEAVPMTAQTALDLGRSTGGRSGDSPGYEVTYEDGYKSWSPADVFEKAYTRLDMEGEPVHQDVAHVLRFFTFAHLPAHLQEISAPFTALAYRVARKAPTNPETTVALRKLLEAKDAAVRAAL